MEELTNLKVIFPFTLDRYNENKNLELINYYGCVNINYCVLSNNLDYIRNILPI